VGDTTGELRKFTQLADVVFVGKSLAPHDGGQTPVEAAVLGKPLLHGPHMTNFREIIRTLTESRRRAPGGDSRRARHGRGRPFSRTRRSVATSLKPPAPGPTPTAGRPVAPWRSFANCSSVEGGLAGGPRPCEPLYLPRMRTKAFCTGGRRDDGWVRIVPTSVSSVDLL
jgi:hypothetical protein